MDGARDHHVKQNKPDSERQISHAFFQMGSLLFKKDINVEKELFRKRKATTGGEVRQERVVGGCEYDPSTSCTCMKMIQ
jgi:hypothetical protein